MPRPSRRWNVLLCALLTGCGATEGPLLVWRDTRDAGSDAALPSLVRPGMSLQYQITGSLDAEVDAELFVVDLFATNAAQVAALHAAGRVVMAYVSVGSLESWREDASSVPAAAVGKQLASYPDERWLDTRSAAVRDLLSARLDGAQAKGFDGMYASTVGAHEAESGFPLTSASELDFLGFLVSEAHARGLSFGLSGDFELAAPLDVDFTIAVGCVARGSCAQLTPWVTRGVPSFDLELTSELDPACAEGKARGIAVTFKRSSFDSFRNVCP